MAVTAYAQLFTATITGTVTDSSGAAASGASIRVVNTATQLTRLLKAGEDGHYNLSQINPGNYSVTVSLAGFKTVKQQISLEAGQNIGLDFELPVGEVSEQVVVTAEVPLLNTEDANKNITLTGEEIKDLPLPTHGAMAAVWAQAGVVAIRTGQGLNATSGDQNTNRFALNGGRDESAAILVDGVSITAGDWGGAVGLPSSESLHEFQVFKAAYDVQYGRTDGGVVSVTTQGGGPTFHGGAFLHYQNAIFNANAWANKRNTTIIPRADYSMKFFGVRVGGPIWRSKKLFFFTNWERVRQTSPSSFTGTVPTQAERNGDFSQTYDYSNGIATLSRIYNPFSSNSTLVAKTAFPNNVINLPFDPVGQKIINLFPLPNTTAINGQNNFIAGGTSATKLDRLDGRADYVLSPKFSVFGTFMKLWNSQDIPAFLGKGLDTNYASYNPLYRGLVSATYVPTATLVINAVGAFSTWHQYQVSPSEIYGLDASTYGLPTSLVSQLSTNTLPAVSFTNYSTIGNARHLNYTLHNFDGQLNVSKLVGNHNFRLGYQVTVQQLNDNDQNSGSFSFSRAMTGGPTPSNSTSTTGNAIASALLGVYNSGSANVAVAPAAQQAYHAWYIEDSWKINPKLTLNYGLRYEIQMPRNERYNRYNHFDEDAVSPLAGSTGLPLKGGLVFANSSNRGMWSPQLTNFAPRFGFAYKAYNNISFRGGYGIFYPQMITTAPTANTDGFSVTNAAIATVNGQGIFANTLISNPFPNGLASAVGSSNGLLTNVGTSVSAFLFQKTTPRMQTYSFDVQLQPTSRSVVEIGYAGSQGRHLASGYTLNRNQMDPSYLPLGPTYLNTAVTNPMYGYLPTSSANNTTTLPRYKLLLPYPQFTSVSLPTDLPKASSSYNALTTKYTQRFGSQLTTIFTYQWSKAIDNTSETQGWETGDAARDYYHLNLERSVSAHDVPQYFTGMVIWKLPFGHGARWGQNMNTVIDGVLGGWEVSSITTFSSGLPYQFSCTNNLSIFGFSACRPNVSDIGQLKLQKRSVDTWFNANVLSNPTLMNASGQVTSYGIGNMPRYTSNVRFGSARRADLTLRKRFKLPQEMNFSIEAAAYNVSNTPQYGQANTSVGNTANGVTTYSNTMGRVTSLAAGSTPRIVEFTGRFNF
ncbi:MAG: TonB-dependent receptor [Edaphobacter sp.]|uniref:TonB-dependent receptor n=1 Tax=Edaphobacter sp. TaxID=1934404 RepID=UPI0023902FE1|nr:TonB-dependent receptor [Edaphobacter sp.]MDE1175039.1 TonB-dependent receptor [Edaphobacter sp.]